MNDTEFQILAATILSALADGLEEAYESGALEDIIHEDGVLTITTCNHRVFVVSKHGPTKQIWLASPISGGLHFVYDAAAKHFQLNDGTVLEKALAENLRACGVEVNL